MIAAPDGEPVAVSPQVIAAGLVALTGLVHERVNPFYAMVLLTAVLVVEESRTGKARSTIRSGMIREEHPNKIPDADSRDVRRQWLPSHDAAGRIVSPV